MTEDFKKWHIIKCDLSKNKKKVFFHEHEAEATCAINIAGYISLQVIVINKK